MFEIKFCAPTELRDGLKELLEKYHQSPVIQEVWIHSGDKKALYGYYFSQYDQLFKLGKIEFELDADL